jgi:hypothetical protein
VHYTVEAARDGPAEASACIEKSHAKACVKKGHDRSASAGPKMQSILGMEFRGGGPFWS